MWIIHSTDAPVYLRRLDGGGWEWVHDQYKATAFGSIAEIVGLTLDESKWYWKTMVGWRTPLRPLPWEFVEVAPWGGFIATGKVVK